MRTMSIAAGLLLALMTTSCGGGGGGWPTGQDINNSLQNTLASVAGDWTGIVNAPTAMRLDFRLQEGSNGQVSGTGTMKEDSAAAAVPITVTGTFQQPTLTLNFEGMVFEGRQVKGSAQGNYTTVGGIATTLTMTAPAYSRAVPILLQEK
ncbi:MAG: hypothetical protein V4723_04045 [Pseudomonadota bacterium]